MNENHFLVVYLDGRRIGPFNWYRSSPCVCRTIHTKFHLDRKRGLLELSHGLYAEMSGQKLLFLSFLGYLPETEAYSQNVWTCILVYISHCARVSASNFQVIVCSGSRDTTLRTVVLILAGPVRMTDRIFTFGAAPTQVQVLGTNHWALELDHFWSKTGRLPQQCLYPKPELKK